MIMIRHAAFALAVATVPCAAETPYTFGSVNDPICTDRPTKANNACTVPNDRFQVEVELFSWSRLDDGPFRSDAYVYPSPQLKYGLTDRSDIELTVTPYVEVRTRAFGLRTRQSGVGDAVLRYKHRFTAEGAGTQVAAIPYLKAPIARRGIGNGEWEGGVIVPVSFSIGSASLTLVPQLDLLANAADPDDRHLQIQGVANLAFPLTDRAVFAVEIWTAQNFDPADIVRQYSADAALTYLVNSNFQLDVGSNFGLNRATPDVQLYLGFSKRF